MKLHRSLCIDLFCNNARTGTLTARLLIQVGIKLTINCFLTKKKKRIKSQNKDVYSQENTLVV